jgi:hypothetical protein
MMKIDICQQYKPAEDALLSDLATSSSQFILILLAETVTNREEVPAPLLIHIPDVGFLTGVLSVWLVDQMHQEEPERKKN